MKHTVARWNTGTLPDMDWQGMTAALNEADPAARLTPAQADAYHRELTRWVADVGDWPETWEFALQCRDDWRQLVPVLERDAMRERVGEHTHEQHDPRYPLRWEPEISSGAATAEELLAEADALAALAADALRLERMLRDHASGNTRPVTDYAEEQTPSCCGGTGFADYAAVPCPNPDCPVVPRLLAEMRTRSTGNDLAREQGRGEVL